MLFLLVADEELPGSEARSICLVKSSQGVYLI
jgi:hypothetical protein